MDICTYYHTCMGISIEYHQNSAKQSCVCVVEFEGNTQFINRKQNNNRIYLNAYMFYSNDTKNNINHSKIYHLHN